MKLVSFNPYAGWFSLLDRRIQCEPAASVGDSPFEERAIIQPLEIEIFCLSNSSQCRLFLMRLVVASQRWMLVTTRPVIGIMSVDSYDDLEDVVSDSGYHGINETYCKLCWNSRKNTICFTEESGWISISLPTIPFLNKLLNQIFYWPIPWGSEKSLITHYSSMGFSYRDGNHDEIGRVALSNLNLAEVEGATKRLWKQRRR